MPTFRPKRQWKPKRKDRNIQRRKARRRWWRRNKAAVKMRRRRRYRALKHNAVFKHWRKKRQKEKHRRRMRFAGAEPPTLPETWFVFQDDADPLTPFVVDMGYVVDYDPDEEELLVYVVNDEEERVVGLDDFLTRSVFIEDADVDNFELLMDQFYGEPADDLDLVPNSEQTLVEKPRPAVVASAWLRKIAFNKENPPDLLGQLGKVLGKAERDAEGPARTRLRNLSMRVKTLGREVQDAWKRRHEN